MGANGGSRLGQNGHFSAVFSSYGTTSTTFLLLSYVYPRKLELRKVTELGLNFKKHLQKCTFTIVKNIKFHFLKNLSFKFKIILMGHWPHVWLCEYHYRTILTFFPYFNTLYERCDLTIVFMTFMLINQRYTKTLNFLRL